jgi:hypothetical protein
VLDLKNQLPGKEKLESNRTDEKPGKKEHFRAVQVADMTTFMARLLYKLTEASVRQANEFIEQ